MWFKFSFCSRSSSSSNSSSKSEPTDVTPNTLINTFPRAPSTSDSIRIKCREMLANALQTGGFYCYRIMNEYNAVIINRVTFDSTSLCRWLYRHRCWLWWTWSTNWGIYPFYLLLDLYYDTFIVDDDNALTCHHAYFKNLRTQTWNTRTECGAEFQTWRTWRTLIYGGPCYVEAWPLSVWRRWPQRCVGRWCRSSWRLSREGESCIVVAAHTILVGRLTSFLSSFCFCRKWPVTSWKKWGRIWPKRRSGTTRWPPPGALRQIYSPAANARGSAAPTHRYGAVGGAARASGEEDKTYGDNVSSSFSFLTFPGSDSQCRWADDHVCLLQSVRK